MCWTKIQKTKPKIRVAKKDIVCYKRLEVCGETLRAPIESSFEYRVNRIAYALNSDGEKLRSISPIDNDPDEWDVYESIHSYTKRIIALSRRYPDETIYRCIIPKGTKYLSNGKEYVSLKLKVLKEV